MVHTDDGLPQRRAMAVFADIRRLNVCRAFAGRLGAVVTVDAVRGNVGVIEVRR